MVLDFCPPFGTAHFCKSGGLHHFHNIFTVGKTGKTTTVNLFLSGP
jgi:hypothetical protein